MPDERQLSSGTENFKSDGVWIWITPLWHLSHSVWWTVALVMIHKPPGPTRFFTKPSSTISSSYDSPPAAVHLLPLDFSSTLKEMAPFNIVDICFLSRFGFFMTRISTLWRSYREALPNKKWPDANAYEQSPKQKNPNWIPSHSREVLAMESPCGRCEAENGWIIRTRAQHKGGRDPHESAMPGMLTDIRFKCWWKVGCPPHKLLATMRQSHVSLPLPDGSGWIQRFTSSLAGALHLECSEISTTWAVMRPLGREIASGCWISLRDSFQNETPGWRVSAVPSLIKV